MRARARACPHARVQACVWSQPKLIIQRQGMDKVIRIQETEDDDGGSLRVFETDKPLRLAQHFHCELGKPLSLLAVAAPIRPFPNA